MSEQKRRKFSQAQSQQMFNLIQERYHDDKRKHAEWRMVREAYWDGGYWVEQVEKFLQQLEEGQADDD